MNVDHVAELPIFDRLLEDILSESHGSETAVSGLGSKGAGIGTRRVPRGKFLAACAVVVAILAAGVFFEFIGSGTTGPTKTTWQAARPLPSAQRYPIALGTASSWRLVGDIVHSGWLLNTAGPEPGDVTCPIATACYVTGNGATSASGPADYDSLYFSDNLGASWSVLALPSGLSFTSSLSCFSATGCAAGGVIGGHSVLVTTVDGAHQWTVMPVSTPGEIVKLRCQSAVACSGIVASAATAASISSDGLLDHADENFVSTTDGGVSWATNPLPAANDVVSSLDCSSSTDCIVIGYPAGRNQIVSGFVRVTVDAGKSWTEGQLPSGFGFENFLSQISCGSATHCMAIGLTAEANPAQCVGANQDPPVGTDTCSSSATTLVSAVVTTADGGLSWQQQALPTDVPNPTLSDVSCASSTECWLVGEEAVAQNAGGAKNGGSSVALGTTDFGQSWTRATFAVPTGAPNDVGHDAYMAIGEVSCPQVGVCLGLGITDQGSASTPVYSLNDASASPSGQ